MANPQNQWVSFEHQIYRLLKAEGVENKSCLLAVSGGADSMALLQVFKKLQTPLGLKIGVVNIHHGPAKNPDDIKEKEQTLFRKHAKKFVQEAAAGLPFYTVESERPLHSENEMRIFRKKEIERLRQEFSFDLTVWAHHQEDFLETQILRMIRGSGPESIFEPMLFLRETELRPLLKISKKEILSYLEDQKIEWLEDPSNQSDVYLRNWVRNTWLPLLEEKCPGALKSFARSLALLQETLKVEDPEGLWLENGLSRPIFLTLSSSQQKQILARFLKKMGQNEYSHNQIEEIMKHLDISQLKHTFHCAGLNWTLTKDLISAKALLL